MEYSALIETIGEVIDLLGVLTIISGIVLSLSIFILEYFKNEGLSNSYKLLRKHLGRTIIIGLELLIAGDIVRSIAVPPTITTVGVLAVIILIRAFLSLQIELETEGKFPWQSNKEK